ncbi:lysophospholipid acyltransferase family protein [Sphaerochaeta halotolerans]|jgi:1-acyl-sn-glycerol-3-phosphate acyltransferase|uniref:1-acyl-sn-glycerol-3-phosphate acyltransferase n=1 Tax=Sphaerochaeta halotolerans TaxID=2293840 RepID=A0A372MF21_9SPIR|nr:lysophospholipid acyltransferase family protein [Sphaerochaeta halotolerans]MBG0766291.1 1-acyl-sn-glycerol-3-phosphate acyltransferase [Spirochaetaceae bacterium]MDK2859201.1 1-acyl-sn-glycerol-3-phosphate acyltransferase [Sphaerochaeta sp.]MDN5333150.1 1-acyl-sn-glycerol-3-phosphate acyltransferase [Sphaerochaeta sp.]MXI85847.1 1-acyl-sn-glycerol-3-phosphate acyltransferase [Sphaerochaeta halotolerans]RFU94369.1 1-acyl-sn-glycerol-3-phosphate acyltransferase [Sphaerochaeta halotolerans]
MKPLSLFLHHIYRTVVKVGLALNYDFFTWQEEALPKGPKLFCSNHFSSSDVHFVTTLTNEPLHMVIGPAFGIPVIGSFLGWTEQIKALNREDRKHVVEEAVSYLKKGDNVYIFPEGDLNTQEELMPFKKGIAEMYLSYPVPIVPIGLIAPKRRVRNKMSKTARREMRVVSRNYYANIGKVMEFPEALEVAKVDREAAREMILTELRNTIDSLIREIKTDKFWS